MAAKLKKRALAEYQQSSRSGGSEVGTVGRDGSESSEDASQKKMCKRLRLVMPGGGGGGGGAHHKDRRSRRSRSSVSSSSASLGIVGGGIRENSPPFSAALGSSLPAVQEVFAAFKSGDRSASPDEWARQVCGALVRLAPRIEARQLFGETDTLALELLRQLFKPSLNDGVVRAALLRTLSLLVNSYLRSSRSSLQPEDAAGPHRDVENRAQLAATLRSHTEGLVTLLSKERTASSSGSAVKSALLTFFIDWFRAGQRLEPSSSSSTLGTGGGGGGGSGGSVSSHSAHLVESMLYSEAKLALRDQDHLCKIKALGKDGSFFAIFSRA